MLLVKRYYLRAVICKILKAETEYHKNSNIIRTIFTKNRRLVAGVHIIHVN